jgi:hypothetical protein
VNALTTLPAAFTYKIVPIFYDSLLAVLVYDFAKLHGVRSPLRCGLLYALCPVSAIIACFHVQWDSLLIFFLLAAIYIRRFRGAGPAALVLQGIALGASIMIKPISIIFIPFFMIDADRRRRLGAFLGENAWFATGGFGIAIAFLIVFAVLGVDPIAHLPIIAGYANSGVTITGLPFAYPFTEFPFLKARLWILGPIVLIHFFFHQGKISFTDSILLTFLVILALGGISPQYLLWPVALLLATGRLHSSALYVAGVSVFYLFYYMNPEAPFIAWENMATFAALKPLGWAMPPAHLADPALLPWIRGMGNYLLPALAVGLAGVIIARAGRRPEAPGAETGKSADILLAAAAAGFLAAIGLIAISHWAGFEVDMSALLKDRLEAYAMHQNGELFAGDYGKPSLFNIFHLGLLAVAAWSTGAAWGVGRRQN